MGTRDTLIAASSVSIRRVEEGRCPVDKQSRIVKENTNEMMTLLSSPSCSERDDSKNSDNGIVDSFSIWST